MTRLLAYSSITLFLITTIARAELQQKAENYQYEYYQPPQKIQNIEPNAVNINVNNQYQGDHDKKWYKDNDNVRKKYLLFETNFSLSSNITINSDQVDYPLIGQNEDIDYQGEGALKTALGLGFTYGQHITNLWSLELDSAFVRLQIQDFDSSFSENINDDYTDTGPEVIVDQNDYLRIMTLSANLVINLYNKTKFTPFAGIGYGYGLLGAESEYDAQPFMLAKAGLYYKLSETMNFYLSGKYYQFGEVKYPYIVEEANSDDINYDERKYILEHDFNFYTINVGYIFKF